MLEQLQFYTRHSLNDLRVNGQRTLFALLCIAAGVAAIVSLQTLAVMIGDTLTGNLQENNRGDIQMTVGVEVNTEANIFQQGVDEGILTEDTVTIFGQSQESYVVSEDGLNVMRAWLEENYPGQAELTYTQPIANMFNIFFGNGNGASTTDVESGDVANPTVPVVIDSDVYPFYGEARTLSGDLVGDVLNEPTDIVVSNIIADQIDLQVGDTIRLNGSNADFVVRGIINAEDEVKNPAQDIFNALFGFYYLDYRSITLFEDIPTKADSIFLKIDNATPELVNEINNSLTDRFPYFETTTTEDLRQDYTDLSESIDQLVTIMGLVSMLIGSIGIINTMQVIVRRRTVEIAVLKTIGLQANQVTILFLVEAVLMGIIGSIAGVFLGWAAVFFIRGAAEAVLATNLQFQIAAEPVINGFLVGVLVTTVFGFLPTLTAGQVRPGLVLRPSDSLMPRAGRLRSLFAIVVIILALTLVAQTILGSFTTALQVILGAFVGVGVLYVILSLLVWIVGRFLPAFGIVDLKISLRQMLAGRSRAAVTLLALVIGVFSLSLITLFAQSITNLLETTLDEGAGGNIAITMGNYNQLDELQAILDEQEGVNSYDTLLSYTVEFVSLEDGQTGDVLTLSDLGDRMQTAAEENPSPFGPPADADFDRAEILGQILGAIDARSPEQVEKIATEYQFVDGRPLTEADENGIVLRRDQFISDAGISVGDKLTFELQNNGIGIPGLGGGQAETITFEVIGLTEAPLVQFGFDNTAYTYRSNFPEDRDPSSINVVVDIDEAFVGELRQQVSQLSGAFLFDAAILSQIVEALLGTFTAFPTMVAALGLVVGGVVIANSVALTTMERRKEIAVMKSVGLQRERVLGMILLENGVMGLIGGLIGVGIGIVGLIAFVVLGELPIDTIPWDTAFLLMGLCIIVALSAALTSAWGASGEKPLNVLRYE